MKILTFFSVFAFLFLWQKTIYAFVFLIFMFFGIYSEIFLFLRIRKNIIKEATLVKESLFYRLSVGDFYLYIFSFFLAFFTLISLFLNLLSIEKFDLFFLFVLLPLLLIFFKKKLLLQFVNNAYNDFRIIVLSSFINALFYAFLKLFFLDFSFDLQDLKLALISYKISVFFIFDFISGLLNLCHVLKLYFLSFLTPFYAGIINFILDFFNFFVLSSCFALLYNFSFKSKVKSLFIVFCFVFFLTFYHLNQSKNSHILPYQKELFFVIENLSFFKEQNLSTLKENQKKLDENLEILSKILDKNAFEISIWWFSKEKKDLVDSLKRAQNAL